VRQFFCSISSIWNPKRSGKPPVLLGSHADSLRVETS
jgi:hypothetical protein